jgi:hypothetical protein
VIWHGGSIIKLFEQIDEFGRNWFPSHCIKSGMKRLTNLTRAAARVDNRLQAERLSLWHFVPHVSGTRRGCGGCRFLGLLRRGFRSQHTFNNWLSEASAADKSAGWAHLAVVFAACQSRHRRDKDRAVRLV